jgi:hypothetical protein
MGILFEILRFAVVLRFGEVVALDDVEMFKQIPSVDLIFNTIDVAAVFKLLAIDNLGLNFEGR